MKFTKYRLAAGLNRSPDPLAAIRGPTSKGREGRGEEGKGRGEGRGRRGGGNLLQGFREDRRPCVERSHYSGIAVAS